MMMQMGYSNVANIRGGFGGLVDNFGQLIEPGWSALNLPLCNTCSKEAGYEWLRGKGK
jgi:hypothetical protein